MVESPGPRDLTDFRHKAWVFDLDRIEGRDRFKLDEALAAEALLLGRVTYETLAAYPISQKRSSMMAASVAPWSEVPLRRG